MEPEPVPQPVALIVAPEPIADDYIRTEAGEDTQAALENVGIGEVLSWSSECGYDVITEEQARSDPRFAEGF